MRNVKVVLILIVFLVPFLRADHPVINEVCISGSKWIEIYNPTSSPIDLSGWSIRNRNGADPLGGTVEPGGYLVIMEEPQSGGLPGHIYLIQDGEIGGGLSSNSDMLELVDPSGNVVDRINWGVPSQSWPNYEPSLWNPGIDIHGSQYIARVPNGIDRDIPEDWREVHIPTPGRPNPLSTGLDTSSWGKIKALFSGGSRRG